VLDEVPLLLVELLPVLGISREVDLLGRPKAGDMFLVHIPNLLVVKREHDIAIRVFLKQGLSLIHGMLFPLGRR